MEARDHTANRLVLVLSAPCCAQGGRGEARTDAYCPATGRHRRETRTNSGLGVPICYVATVTTNTRHAAASSPEADVAAWHRRKERRLGVTQPLTKTDHRGWLTTILREASYASPTGSTRWVAGDAKYRPSDAFNTLGHPQPLLNIRRERVASCPALQFETRRRGPLGDASSHHLGPQGGERKPRPARHEHWGHQVLPENDERNGLGARTSNLRHDQRVVRRRHLRSSANNTPRWQDRQHISIRGSRTGGGWTHWRGAGGKVGRSNAGGNKGHAHNKRKTNDPAQAQVSPCQRRCQHQCHDSNNNDPRCLPRLPNPAAVEAILQALGPTKARWISSAKSKQSTRAGRPCNHLSQHPGTHVQTPS